MGTSANLGIKSGKKQFVVHTSYNADPGNVFTLIAASLAAVGIDALQKAIKEAKWATNNDDEDNLEGLSNGFARYLEAAQLRGGEGWGLYHAINSQYGPTNFADSGVISLFSDPLLNDTGWGSFENSDFRLDLDTGTLSYMCYESHEDYQQGKPTVPAIVLDLRRIENLNPDIVAHVMGQMGHLDIEMEKPFEVRQAPLEKAMAMLAQGAVMEAGDTQSFQYQNRLPNLPHDGSAGSHEKGQHYFLAHPDNTESLVFLASLLQRWGADQLKALGRPGVLKLQQTPNIEGAAVLFVDLGAGFSDPVAGEQVHQVLSQLGELSGSLGIHYQMKQNGIAQSRGGGSIISSISIGGDDGDDLDDDLLFGGRSKVDVSLAVDLPTRKERLEAIEADIQAGTEEADTMLHRRAMLALATLDTEIINMLPGQALEMSQEEGQSVAAMLTQGGKLEDGVDQGARQARWQSLSAELQQSIVAPMNDLEKFIIKIELGAIKQIAAKGPRP